MATLYTATQLAGSSLPEVTFSLPGTASGFLLTNNSVWTLQVTSPIWSVPVPPYAVLTAPATAGLSVTVRGLSANAALLTLANPAVTWGTSTVSVPLNVQPLSSTNASSLVPTGTGNVISTSVSVTAAGGSSSGSLAIPLAPTGQVRIIGLLNWLVKSPNGIIYTVTLSGSLNGTTSLQYAKTNATNDSLTLTPVQGGPDLVDTLTITLAYANVTGNPPAVTETVTVIVALDGNAIPNLSGSTSPVVSSILITGPSGLESPGALDPTSNLVVTVPVAGGTQGQPLPIWTTVSQAQTTLAAGAATNITPPSGTSLWRAGQIAMAVTNSASTAQTVYVVCGPEVNGNLINAQVSVPAATTLYILVTIGTSSALAVTAAGNGISQTQVAVPATQFVSLTPAGNTNLAITYAYTLQAV